MYYFDNEYLAQYIDQQVDLMVYANGKWYQVADRSDLIDPIEGVGYNEDGEGYKFKYKDIKELKVGDTYFTLDQLQSQRTGNDAMDDEKSSPAKKPDDGGEDKPDEEPDKEKEPELDLSHFSPVYDLGRDLINEYFKDKDKKG